MGELPPMPPPGLAEALAMGPGYGAPIPPPGLAEAILK